MKKILLIFTLMILTTAMAACQPQSKAEYIKITPEEAKVIMDKEKSFILIDVRTEAEFNEGHIEGAMLIPLDTLESVASEKLPDKDQKILVYCRSGNRSNTATHSLLDLGYTNVIDFGGLIDWPYEIVN